MVRNKPIWGLRKDKQTMDAKKQEVAFWLKAAEFDVSRCNEEVFKDMRSRLQRTQCVADRMRKEHPQEPEPKVLNLAVYSQKLAAEWIEFCSPLIKVFYDHLEEATRHNYKPLYAMTDGIHDIDRLSPFEVGKRVGAFIVSVSNQTTLNDLGRSLDNVDIFKDVYRRYTPCAGVLAVAQYHKGWYEMLTKSRYFKLKSYIYPSTRTSDRVDTIKNWLDRVAICAFIEESQQVFTSAVEYMVETESMIETFAGGRRANREANEYRYNSIFRYGAGEMSYAYIKAALAVLNSDKTGFLIYDTRRTDVSFWLEAALDDISKCTGDDDYVLRLNLEFDQARAQEAAGGRNLTAFADRVFNLGHYVHSIRSKRLKYCDHYIGAYFSNKLLRWRKNSPDLQALVDGFYHLQPFDINEMAKRVAELVKRKEPEFGKRISSSDSHRVRGLYFKHSFCVELMAMVRGGRYIKYYGLLTAPGNYQKVNADLRRCVDIISACIFIEKEPNVFKHAAQLLPLMTTDDD